MEGIKISAPNPVNIEYPLVRLNIDMTEAQKRLEDLRQQAKAIPIPSPSLRDAAAAVCEGWRNGAPMSALIQVLQEAIERAELQEAELVHRMKELTIPAYEARPSGKFPDILASRVQGNKTPSETVQADAKAAWFTPELLSELMKGSDPE